MLLRIRKKAEELMAQKIEEVNVRKSKVFKDVIQKLEDRNRTFQTIFQENSHKSAEHEQIPTANPEVVPAMPEATQQAASKASGWMGS